MADIDQNAQAPDGTTFARRLEDQGDGTHAPGQVLYLQKADGTYVQATGSDDGRLLIPNPDIDIPAGNVTGQTEVLKFGLNAAVATSLEDIWETGGIYAWYPTAAVAVDIVSSNSGDGQDIEVFGLDGTGALQNETVTLTGDTEKDLAKTYWRIFRAINRGTTDLAGTVTIAADGAAGGIADNLVAATIVTVQNQTNMAIYTVPLGKTGYISQYYASTDKLTGSPANVDVELRVRPHATVATSEVFQTKNHQGLTIAGTSHFQHTFKPYFKVLALSDILVRAVASAGTVEVHAGFDMILVDD